MNSIVYVGMDVHKEQYTICCYSYETDKVEYKQTIPSDYKLVLKYIEQVRSRYDGEVTFVCGYEAGCLGYSFVYSWKLEPTDKLPKGKKPCLSLRELKKQVNTDLDLLVDIVDGQMTVCELVDRYLKTKTEVRQSMKQGWWTVKPPVRSGSREKCVFSQHLQSPAIPLPMLRNPSHQDHLGG